MYTQALRNIQVGNSLEYSSNRLCSDGRVTEHLKLLGMGEYPM